MEEEHDNNAQPPILPPLPGHLAEWNHETFPRYIAETYGVPNDAELHFLIEKLDGLAWIDLPAREPAETLTDRRRALRDAAAAMRNAAELAHTAISTMREALATICSVLGDEPWSTVLLSDVFDIRPSHYGLPEVLAPLRSPLLLIPNDLDAVESELRALSKIQLKPSLKSGTVGNGVLRRSLLECRMFWLLHGRKWRREMIHLEKFREVLDNDDRRALRKTCEGFVVDMLTAANMNFTVINVNSGWASLIEDQKKRRKSLASHK